MTTKANIVIIGAGIVGVSVAYHLTQMGVKDIIVIDKGDLDQNDGSTSHAPGGLRVVTPSDFYTRLGKASRAVYDKLPLAIEGQEQFFRTGGIQMASTPDRFDSYKRIIEMGLTMGVEAHLLTPQEVHEKIPLVDPKKIIGGLHIPDSGAVNTSLLATSMRRIAEATGGATFYGYTEAIDVMAEAGRVQAVLTANPDLPRIDCERVVLCNNIWAPILCAKLGVNMPLFPGQHQYIFTEPILALGDLAKTEVALPIATVDDISIYYRQHHERIGIGSYHHKAMLVDPYKLECKAEFPFTPEDFETAWGLMQGYFPALQQSGISHGFNGMFSFTVDGFPIMGESPVKGFWTAVGPWLSYASEVGRVMARWMTTGDPGMDMTRGDISRFHPYQLNRRYLTEQSKYFYEIGFDIIHPGKVASKVRNLRLSPYIERVRALEAQFGVFAGIETPLWYEANAPLVDKYRDQIPERNAWDSQYWSPIQGAEHLELRNNVGLVDWSGGIGPIEMSGEGALAYLNYLCTNEMDKPIGSIIYTLLLTPSGGIKRDITVARLGEDRFWLMTGKSNFPAELAWIRQHAPKDGLVEIVDRSDAYISLCLWGPNSRKVLEKVTDADVSNKAFPFYTVQEIGIGMAPALALRISYVGELGWEIYAPANYGLHLWDTLWEAGREFDMPACGSGSIFSLRLEKGYRLWSVDMDTERNPYEAGLGWLVKYKKGDFIGRTAALKARKSDHERMLCCMVFDDPSAMMYGFEPIMVGGKVVGRITSGNFGYSIGKFIGYGYVDSALANVGQKVVVRYTGRDYVGTISAEPLFDKGMARLKA